MKLRGRILLLILLPILALGAITYIISSIEVTKAMKEEVQQGLKASAIVLESEITAGENGKFQVKSGELYYGDKCITDETDVVDKLRDETGMVATVFYGDVRYMTSVLDSETGKPVLGTKASEEVVKQVLEGGNEYFGENVDIQGVEYFTYYRPLYDSSSKKPIGMVFTGMNQEEVEDKISTILTIILVVIVLIAILCVVVAFLMLNKITGRITRGIKALDNVANGDLTIKLSANDKKAKDETGEMSRAIEKLKDNLSNIVGEIKQNSAKVHEFSVDLSKNMSEASATVNQVEIAVTEIADGAGSQADDTQVATTNVIDMGNVIEVTGEEVVNLSNNTMAINRSSDEATNILKGLEEINRKTKLAIDEIYDQTNTTNKAALKISEVTALISSIADETNLLSLNASIEAARAGEAGRGFAVVADQIQKLAEQSTESTQQIAEIVNELMSDSEKAVATMEEVKTIVAEQNTKIEMTSKIFGEVKSEIDKSTASVKIIDDKTKVLDRDREKVVDIVQNLSAIAEENAASTEETSAAVTEVSAVISDISGRSLELKDIAEQLNETISTFKI